MANRNTASKLLITLPSTSYYSLVQTILRTRHYFQATTYYQLLLLSLRTTTDSYVERSKRRTQYSQLLHTLYRIPTAAPAPPPAATAATTTTTTKYSYYHEVLLLLRTSTTTAANATSTTTAANATSTTATATATTTWNEVCDERSCARSYSSTVCSFWAPPPFHFMHKLCT